MSVRFAAVLIAFPAFAAAASWYVKATPATVAIGHYSANSVPVISIKSGDVVDIQTVSGDVGNLRRIGVAEKDIPPALIAIEKEVKDRGPGGHILTGPIFIEGAEPGDTLEVHIDRITLPVPYAYNSFRSTAGFLPEDFPHSASRLIPLDLARNVALFAPNIEIPLRPFFGSMGVAPPRDAGRLNSGPPWLHAGNLDNKELIAGTTLYIPVYVKGALFQVGDGHAGQGDGEVDITALETSLNGVFRFIVRKDMHLKWPRAETPTHYIMMGMNEELIEATKQAVREMIEFLATEKGLSRDDAYMLTSVAADFAITQLVDGKKGVHGTLRKSLFIKAPAAVPKASRPH